MPRINVEVSEDQKRDLSDLAALWGLSEAAAVRLLITAEAMESKGALRKLRAARRAANDG